MKNVEIFKGFMNGFDEGNSDVKDKMFRTFWVNVVILDFVFNKMSPTVTLLNFILNKFVVTVKYEIY